MKQALFILAVALYLVSLCACGDQKIQSKSKQGSATQQVVQEQMANATRRNDRSADCNSGAAACFG